ncbi:hypothetical protein [Acidovorax sp. BL-A-41-H1]|uniref:hypothetical protein n=1 Tax=Acidovorax sp. BL-A-41-H1 TaxID=3421102 RepID=UPI003F78BA8F
MAGDWIKMRANLLTHPKVVRMSSAFNADRVRTVGGLYAVWCLFDMHSEDGLLEGYTPQALDDLAGLPGISAAMLSVGWLVQSDLGLQTPEFETHNGQSAKRRAQETERKRNDRKLSASGADEMRIREEKRREEVIDTAPSPKSPRGTALPADWTLPDDWKTWAVNERPDVDVVTVAESFRDFWIAKPGKDGRKTDWQATWRNWVRNQRAQPGRRALPAGDVWAGAVN